MSRIIVAITKTDRVDDELLVMVKEDVAVFLKTTPYQNALIIPFSSVIGLGKKELMKAVDGFFIYFIPASGTGLAFFNGDRPCIL
ncbi:MAG: hypothetical protein ACUVQ6_07775 [Dissulfurimicrobium sp.]|uniref:hypothetical protein n=1 Tax=Dissulfurimicrobium sp. TaxID=2022436 RepID=UPI00404A342E